MTENGSPDDIVAGAVKAGAAELQRWGQQLLDATDGLQTGAEIAHALDRAAEKIDPTEFARIVAEALMHGAALGAADSFVQREDEEPEPSPRLAACRKILQKSPASKLPFGEAIKRFEEREVIPRPLFDQLSDAAKQRAFTVAGLAAEELLGDAHAELTRMLKDSEQNTFKGPDGKWVYKGPDLRQFKKFATERLESAGWTPANSSHVETIFRTNVQSAYSAGRVAEMSQPEVLKARPFWQIKSNSDSRTRETHHRATGTILPADHPFWTRAFPPFGYNCFLPGTEIRGAFVGASRARYSGETIQLATAEGRGLTVTANHPILTNRGFVPAKSLKKGDYVVGYFGQTGVELLGTSAQSDENYSPSTVEQVFSSLANSFMVLRSKPGSDDFHGEAASFIGEIEVVGTYAGLTGKRKTTGAAESQDLGLKSPDAASLGTSPGLSPIAWIDGSAPSEMGSLSLPLYGSGDCAHAHPLHTLRIGLPSELDTESFHRRSDGFSADTELFSKLIDGVPGLVSKDEIVDIVKGYWSGHVYDFQTESGWLYANNIVASNCRCTVISRSERWVREHGGQTAVPTGLPDPGFSSGTHTLISAGLDFKQESLLPPTVKPKEAHPIDREPRLPVRVPPASTFAPVVSPTTPTHDIVPRSPDPIPVAAHAFEAGRHALSISLGRGVSKEIAQHVYESFDPSEVATMNRDPLKVLTLKQTVRVKDVPVNGCYTYNLTGSFDELSVSVNRLPSSFGDKFVPGKSFSMSSSRATEKEAITTTLHHEFGHRLHIRAGAPIDREVAAAFIGAKPITEYAGQNRREWFAECYAAYRSDPAALRAHDPVGFAIVERVLDYWGMPHV